MQKIKIVYNIIETLCKNGFEAYFAGGFVRDMLMGVEPSDFDVATNARPDVIKALFRDRKVTVAGKSFNVCIVDGIEVATYRRGRFRSMTDPNRNVELADNIHEDLKRRDLSINSMAFCPYSGDIIDDFNGAADLKDKVIRFTANPADRIREDPCRILRACRFLSKIEGRFDSASFDALCRYKTTVKAFVAPERVRGEVLKALEYDRPSIFFKALHDIGVLGDILPCLEKCFGLDGGPYPNETVFDHCMKVGDALSAKRPLLRLAGFLHDVGKAETAGFKNGRLTFIGHETAIDGLLSDLSALKFSTDEWTFVKDLVNIHMRKVDADTSPQAVRRLIVVLRGKRIPYTDFLRFKIANKKGNTLKPDLTLSEIKSMAARFRAELSSDKPRAFVIKDLAVTGFDVMRILDVPAGPVVGRTLQSLLDAVIDDPGLNTYENLTRLIKKKSA
jgi:tRNA nucleotidyltransferase (CCA-adding enzyme)